MTPPSFDGSNNTPGPPTGLTADGTAHETQATDRPHPFPHASTRNDIDGLTDTATGPISPSTIETTTGQRIKELEAEMRGLQERQTHQCSIEQAKGMLMSYYGISADTAFTVLRRWSQNSNVKLRDLAAQLVTTGSRPSPQPFGALHDMLATYAVTPGSEFRPSDHSSTPDATPTMRTQST